MRIGLISADFAPNVGGVAAHVVELGKALALAGHEVHVITLPLGEMRQKHATWEGMQVHRPAIPKGKPIYSWLLGRWLRKFLKATPLDILHVHGLRPLEATRGLNTPVVFTNHTSGFLRRIEKGERELLKMASRLQHVKHVLAPSDQLCEATRTTGYAGPVDFIPNGVDIERFQPRPSMLREKWSVSEKEIVVLLARRLVDKNGVVIFAEATSALKDLPVKIVFAGDGPERDRVTAILKENGMHDKALFLGNVPNPQMPEIYNAADISVLPSYMEATSITGLESMACGVPLVGTNVGGIPVLIDEGKTGFIVPPGNPEELGRQMHTLAQDPQLRRSMGAQARKKASTEFSWEKIAVRTVEIYTACL
ncbi:MAG: glycosyltransferase family 4 protein [Candidatus Sedimenticola sp. 1PA]